MFLIFLIAAGIAADQLVKYIVSTYMTLGQTIPVIQDFFHITYIHNEGAAFGIMAGNELFLIALPAVLMAAGAVALFTLKKKLDKMALVAGALVISGGIGNLIDRICYGYVIDFIDFKIWNPIFNIADIAVCAGCGLLILYLIYFDGRDNGKRKNSNNNN